MNMYFKCQRHPTKMVSICFQSPNLTGLDHTWPYLWVLPKSPSGDVKFNVILVSSKPASAPVASNSQGLKSSTNPVQNTSPKNVLKKMPFFLDVLFIFELSQAMNLGFSTPVSESSWHLGRVTFVVAQLGLRSARSQGQQYQRFPIPYPVKPYGHVLCRMVGYAVCVQWVEDWQLSKVILENLWLYTTWYKSIAISMIKILHWLTWLLSHCSVKSSALARQTLFIKLMVHGVSLKIYIHQSNVHPPLQQIKGITAYASQHCIIYIHIPSYTIKVSHKNQAHRGYASSQEELF